jgi:hypothetical protein
MEPTWLNDDVVRMDADGAHVEMHHEDPETVLLDLWMESGGPSAAVGAGLMCAAVTRARAHHARRVDAALDAVSPACGVVLEALRARIGTDVRGLGLRRAGSSVMVTVDLLPPDEAPTPTAPPRVRRVPARPAPRVPLPA